MKRVFVQMPVSGTYSIRIDVPDDVGSKEIICEAQRIIGMTGIRPDQITGVAGDPSRIEIYEG